MKRLKLNNFIINRIVNIIGHYDDIKNKKSNIFNNEHIDDNDNKKVKKYKRFEIKLELKPKYPQSYIVSSDDVEIGDFANSRVDIIPFLKNDEFYYSIRDSGVINAKFIINMDDYYTYIEGSRIIKQKIKNDEIEYVWEDTMEKIEEVFMGRQKHFNYIKDIEWIAD